MLTRISIFIMLLFIQAAGHGQSTLIKDIDMDGIKDSVYIDSEASVIVCRLSGQQFRKMESQPVDILNESAGITQTKNGFEFYNNWMRSGFRNQFRYDAKTAKIQLIGMSRYEFGNAANDGSGESSVNVLNGDYIGNWNYYDIKKEKLIKIPTIKTKMKFKYISLEAFSDKTYYDYSDKCSELYEQSKKAMQKVR